MARAIVTASAARNIAAIYAGVALVKIPGATNGVVQAWDTNDANLLIGLGGLDADLTFYTDRASIPRALWPYLVQVRRSDSAGGAVNIAWKRLADCGAGDFFRIVGGGTRTLATLAAGERPLDTRPVHVWAGTPLVASATGLGDDDDLGGL
jgi:hypothetical protein